MKRQLLAYAVALLTLLALDLLWIGVWMPQQYQDWIGGLLLTEPRLLPAVLFYLLYALGLLVFAVQPGLAANSLRRTLVHAALLGAVAYGTYDLSNYATLRGWPLTLTCIDMLWGVCLSCCSAASALLLARRLAPDALR